MCASILCQDQVAAGDDQGRPSLGFFRPCYGDSGRESEGSGLAQTSGGGGIEWSIAYASMGGIVGRRNYTLSEYAHIVFYAYYYVTGIPKILDEMATKNIQESPLTIDETRPRAQEFAKGVMTTTDMLERYFLCTVISRMAIMGEILDDATRMTIPPFPGLVLTEYIRRESSSLVKGPNPFPNPAHVKALGAWILGAYPEGVEKLVGETIEKVFFFFLPNWRRNKFRRNNFDDHNITQHGIVCFGPYLVSHPLQPEIEIPWTIDFKTTKLDEKSRIRSILKLPIPKENMTYSELKAMAPALLDLLVFHHATTHLCPIFFTHLQKLDPRNLKKLLARLEQMGAPEKSLACVESLCSRIKTLRGKIGSMKRRVVPLITDNSTVEILDHYVGALESDFFC